MAARRIDALIVGILTIGLAVVVATVPVSLAWLDEKEEEEEEEEFAMQLGPVKTAVFGVYYVCSIIFLLVLTSWSKAENLMLGGAGLAWEVIWIWLVVVLATDVLGYFFRAVQAVIMKRQIHLTDPAISIVMSVLPILGPRVDLLKDCLFAGAVFQLAVCQPDDSWRRTAGFRVGDVDGMLEAVKDKFDKILKEVQLSIVEASKISSQSLAPLKRGQETMNTTLGEKTTEILKEISNVFHRVKKEGGDLMAMVKWRGCKTEQVEKDCAHQPDRLQILRDTLMEIQMTVVRIQSEVESEHGDGDNQQRAASPEQREWANSPTAPPQQPINLEETVPHVQLMRSGASPLTSITLTDGRVVYVPRSVVANLFGAHF
ncbi:pol [Symbiodinium sp. CCMP2592]|nr:pol [Symbiodinium sp. CCMP2592]